MVEGTFLEVYQQGIYDLRVKIFALEGRVKLIEVSDGLTNHVLNN